MAIYIGTSKVSNSYGYTSNKGSVQFKTILVGSTVVYNLAFDPIIYDGQPTKYVSIEYDAFSVFNAIEIVWKRGDGAYTSIILYEYGFYYDYKTGGEGVMYSLGDITEVRAPDDSIGIVAVYGYNF